MATKKVKKSWNWFDVVVGLLVALVLISLGLAWGKQPQLGSAQVYLKVLVKDPATISQISQALPKAQEIFIDSHRYGAQQVDYRHKVVEGQEVLEITLVGPGEIKADRAFFLGQRVYANREVILKGDYLARGWVVDYGLVKD